MTVESDARAIEALLINRNYPLSGNLWNTDVWLMSVIQALQDECLVNSSKSHGPSVAQFCDWHPSFSFLEQPLTQLESWLWANHGKWLQMYNKWIVVDKINRADAINTITGLHFAYRGIRMDIISEIKALALSFEQEYYWIAMEDHGKFLTLFQEWFLIKFDSDYQPYEDDDNISPDDETDLKFAVHKFLLREPLRRCLFMALVAHLTDSKRTEDLMQVAAAMYSMPAIPYIVVKDPYGTTSLPGVNPPEIITQPVVTGCKTEGDHEYMGAGVTENGHAYLQCVKDGCDSTVMLVG